MGYDIVAYRRLMVVPRPNDAEEAADGIWRNEERLFFEIDGIFYTPNNATMSREIDIGHSDGEDIFAALPPALSEILREILETSVTSGVKTAQCGHLLSDFLDGGGNAGLEEGTARNIRRISKIFVSVENDGLIFVS